MAAYAGLVPLENGGGSSTAGSHWDEANFKPNSTASKSSKNNTPTLCPEI
jgi:hypothetical protein